MAEEKGDREAPKAERPSLNFESLEEMSIQRTVSSRSNSSVNFNELTGDIEIDLCFSEKLPRLSSKDARRTSSKDCSEAPKGEKRPKGDSQAISLPPKGDFAPQEKKVAKLKPAPSSIFSVRIDQIHPLSTIMLVGGYLCLSSGWVNGVAFRGYDGGVTHVTGTATSIGLNLAQGKLALHLRASAKLLSFWFGATVSSAYLGTESSLKSDPRYAHLLLLVSGSMYGAFLVESADWLFPGALLLAFGSGAQNALTTIYSGAVLRSTHVTGTVTDMGIELGKILFHDDKSGLWKLQLLTTFLACYVLGGLLGALCFSPAEIEGVDFVGAEAKALLVPATGMLALAMGWLIKSRLGLDLSRPRGRRRTESGESQSPLSP
jgi:uncharacterized membrane protein YoaK (UPF0700 family)